MSGIGTTLDVLRAHPQSFPAILLLRTIAIYSRSKHVVIPLSIAYVVCPQEKFLRLYDPSNVQAATVTGITITWYHLHTTHGE